jgi:hypothetical protein
MCQDDLIERVASFVMMFIIIVLLCEGKPLSESKV